MGVPVIQIILASVASHRNTAHSSQHRSHASHYSHPSSRPSHGDHGSHSSHVSGLQAQQQQTLPSVRVPQTTNDTTLPSSIELSKLPQILNVPDTIAPTFSVAEVIVPPPEKE